MKKSNPLDADLEYNPSEYNILLKPITDGFADVLNGSSFMGSKPHRISFFGFTIVNILLTLISNMFTSLNQTDMETCYKVFKTEIIQSLKLEENRFGFESDETTKIPRILKILIYDVGISPYCRNYEEGKKLDRKTISVPLIVL